MDIREINDKNRWENFLNEVEPHTFLQSWNWGEFNRRMGSKIWRLGFFENGEFAAIALVLKINARRGSFLFCPHGPIVVKHEAGSMNHGLFGGVTSELSRYLVELAQKEKVSFIRISPLLPATEENSGLFKNLKFKDAPVHMMHPERAWILDISKSEEELFRDMRKQTRHCIRNAQEAGVEVEISRDPNDVERFYQIHQATVARQNFTPFSFDYLKKEFEAFAEDDDVLLFFGKYRGETLSAAFVVFAYGSAFYHHGASVLKYPKIPASHLVQWEIIREAKRRGCRWYNLWGIAPQNADGHPWAGLTLFKKGFGGFAEDYIHAQDLPLRSSYWITYAIELARRRYRHL